MLIKSLYLKNYKVFREKNFTLSPRFTVLIGDNGKGKTSVLDALAIFIGTYLLEVREEDIKKVNIKTSDVNQILTNINGIINSEPQYPVIIKGVGIINDSTIEWSRELNGPDRHTTTKNSQTLRDIVKRELSDIAYKKDVTLPVLGYYGTGRLWTTLKNVDIKKT